MFSRLHGTSAFALFLNVSLFVAACLIINGIIFGAGFEGGTGEGAGPLVPPGWVVGVVWTLLFAALGVASWLLNDRVPSGSRKRLLIPALAAFCLAYPFYTGGLGSPSLGLIGNIATAIAALVVAGVLATASRRSALLVSLVALWVSYASIGLVLR